MGEIISRILRNALKEWLSLTLRSESAIFANEIA